MSAMLSVDSYRRNWPRLGGVLAMGVAGAAALAAGKVPASRMMSILNFGALLVHQYEEYEDPGYFPGQFNRGMFGSDIPDRYPLNSHVAMIINTAIAYPFYIAPILFPRRKWVGIAPALFGMAQAAGHGIVFPRRAGARYSPGFLASMFLHVPLGIQYLRAVGRESGITRADIAKGVAYAIAFAAGGVAAPNLVLRDRNSPYAFTRRQVGPYAATGSAAPSPDPASGDDGRSVTAPVLSRRPPT